MSGPEPIRHADVMAWAQAHGEVLDERDWLTIERLDATAIVVWHEKDAAEGDGAQPEAPPPHSKAQLADNLRSAFRDLGAIQIKGPASNG